MAKEVIYKTRIPVKQYSTEYRPMVYTGGVLSIRYYSETGRFNLLSDEESTKVHVYIYKDGTRLNGISIDTDDGDDYNGTDVQEILWLFEQDRKRHWVDTASSKKLAISSFISMHEEEIEYGNALEEIETLKREISDKSARLEYLTRIYLNKED